MKPRFMIVRTFDWEALYRDGKLVAENHRISARTLADHSEILLESFTLSEEDFGKICGDSFPADLGEITKEIEGGSRR